MPEPAIVQKVLEDFLLKSEKFLALETACYGRNPIPADKAPESTRLFQDWKYDNVAQESKVFWGGEGKLAKPKVRLPEEMKYWQYALAGGNPQNVRTEAFLYLDKAQLDADSLKKFYHSFLQTLANAQEQMGISNYQIFQDKESMQNSLTAYKSLDSMKELIDYVTVFLSKIQEKMNVAQTLLKTTNFSIGTIAMKVGFGNFSHFSQMYKKTMGVNPAEERNSRQKDKGI